MSRHLIAVFLGRERERLASLAVIDTSGWQAIALSMEPYLRVLRPDIADERLGRYLEDPLAEGKVLVRVRKVWLSFERGRWEEAKGRIRELRGAAPALQPALLGLLAAAGGVPLSMAELDSVRRTVAAELPRATDPEAIRIDRLFEQAEGSWPVRRLYLLGLLDVRRGDMQGAQRSETALASYRGREIDRQWAQLYAASIEAHRLAAGGRNEEALRRFEQTTFRSEPTARLSFRTLAAERFLLAKLYRAQGRLDEATRWLATVHDMFWFDYILAAPAELERGLLAEARNDWAAAARHYEDVVRLWSDCDARYLPLRNDAETRLARVRAMTTRS